MHSIEITIQRRAAEGYPVVAEVQRPGGLPLRAEGLLELDAVELLSLLEPRAYGTLLGRGVFSGGVRDAFVAALAASDGRLRTLLFVEAPDLRGLRWERLCWPADGDWDFLALDQRVPFSIYLPSTTDRRFRDFGRADLRALLVVASPTGLERFGFQPFDDAGALATVTAGLEAVPFDVLSTVRGPPPTLDALCAALTDQPYTLLHVVAHGLFQKSTGDTAILLADDAGNAVPVDATTLIGRLGRITGPRGLPHLAFLSTCESADPRAEGALGGLAHRLVRDLGMPAVVAMTEKVSQATALALGRAFYPRLLQHGEVDRALTEATVDTASRADATVPALYSRLGARPLFSDDITRPPTPLELERALGRLDGLFRSRAPILMPRLNELATTLRRSIDQDPADLSEVARREREDALADLGALCEEVLDLSFQRLALGADPPVYDERCPFPGLRAFTPQDRRFFFGRDPLLDRLEADLERHPFLAVLGSSGSGKSSLVMAGLVGRLESRSDSLNFVRVVPGSTPIANLERGLRRSSLGPLLEGRGDRADGALLMVDQFEEVFTLCTDPAQQERYFAQLLSLSRVLPVVVTMRADFWGSVAPHADLRRAMEQHQILVPPMNPRELRGAIEQQAAAVGLRFDTDLAATILQDVTSEPGAMPLLQHALLELWKRRHGRWLRVEEYRAVGGVVQAISSTAETIWAQLDAGDRARVRHVFTRLTRVDADDHGGSRDTRRRVELSELIPAGEEPGPLHALVRRLADSRLVVTNRSSETGQETIEVAHEALIRHWPRLRSWLDEDRAMLQKLAMLAQAAREWDEGGREEGLLILRGSRLEDIEELRRSGRYPLSALESTYVDACVQYREDQKRAAEEQQQRELEQARLLAEAEAKRAEEAREAAILVQQRARVIGLVAVLAFVALGVAGVMWSRARKETERAEDETERAEKEAEKAEQRRKQAVASTLRANLISLENDPTAQALLLQENQEFRAVQAWQLGALSSANRPRADFALDRPYPESDGLHWHHGESIAFGPEGRVLAQYDGNARFEVWDLQRRRRSHARRLTASFFGGAMGLHSPDGGAAIFVRSPGSEPSLLLHTGSLELEDAPDVAPIYWPPVVRLDGRLAWLASGEGDCARFLWTQGAPEPRCLVPKGAETAPMALLLPGPRLLLEYGAAENAWSRAKKDLGTSPILVRSIDSGALLDSWVLEHSTGNDELALYPSPDGWMVAAVDGGVFLRLLRFQADGSHETGPPEVVVLRDSRWDARLGPDSALFPSGGVFLEGTLSGWRTDDSLLADMDVGTRTGQPVAFGPDGVVAIAGGNAVHLVDPTLGSKDMLYAHDGPVRDLVLSPDGRRLASADALTMRVWTVPPAVGTTRLRGEWTLVDASDSGAALLRGPTGLWLFPAEAGEARRLLTTEDADAGFLGGEQPSLLGPECRFLGAGTDQSVARPWDAARMLGAGAQVRLHGSDAWGLDTSGEPFCAPLPVPTRSESRWDEIVQEDQVFPGVGAVVWSGLSAHLLKPDGSVDLIQWREAGRPMSDAPQGLHPTEIAVSIRLAPSGLELVSLLASGRGFGVGPFKIPIASLTAPKEGEFWESEAVGSSTSLLTFPGTEPSDTPQSIVSLNGWSVPAWSGDGTRAALASGDAIGIWTQGQEPRFVGRGRTFLGSRLHFVPDGEHLVEVGPYTTRVWPTGAGMSLTEAEAEGLVVRSAEGAPFPPQLARRSQTQATQISLLGDEGEGVLAVDMQPTHGGKGLVILRSGRKTSWLERVVVDPGRAAEEVLEQPGCLQPGWRALHLGESTAEANTAFCACQERKGYDTSIAPCTPEPPVSASDPPTEPEDPSPTAPPG